MLFGNVTSVYLLTRECGAVDDVEGEDYLRAPKWSDHGRVLSHLFPEAAGFYSLDLADYDRRLQWIKTKYRCLDCGTDNGACPDCPMVLAAERMRAKAGALQRAGYTVSFAVQK
jgi:hypothetical protein